MTPPKPLGVESLEPVAWNDVPNAPKDGSLLRLLVVPDEDAHTSFHDSSTPYETIGFNQFTDTGDDVWQFAGWDWSHDCITQGYGEVIGWLPFASAPEVATQLQALSADRDALAAPPASPDDLVTEGVTPDHCYDPKNWEYSMLWDDRNELVETWETNKVHRVSTLINGPDKWVVICWDEVNGEEIRWFDSEAEAIAATPEGTAIAGAKE